MSIGYYFQVIVSLAILAGGLYLLLRFSRKIQQKRYSGEIKIIDRLPVDANSTLLIVDVRKQEFLMSASGKNITVIEKL